MPSRLYNRFTGGKYRDDYEMMQSRKIRDNIAQKISYWRRVYGYDLTTDDYEEFNKHCKVIKKVRHIHDFICSLDKNKIQPHQTETYAKHHKEINEALKIQGYIKTLRKIGEKTPVRNASNPVVVVFD